MRDESLADNAEAALRLLESVDRPNFKLSFEVSHRANGEPPRERLERVLDHVAHVHLRNLATYATDGGERAVWAPIADGLVDYYPLVEALAEHGYSGCYALEFASREGNCKRELLAADLAHLKSLFKLMGRPV